jgi:hypothetical protein
MRNNYMKSSCKSYETISRYGRADTAIAAELRLEDGILDITELDSPLIETETEFLQVFLKEAKLLH